MINTSPFKVFDFSELLPNHKQNWILSRPELVKVNYAGKVPTQNCFIVFKFLFSTISFYKKFNKEIVLPKLNKLTIFHRFLFTSNTMVSKWMRKVSTVYLTNIIEKQLLETRKNEPNFYNFLIAISNQLILSTSCVLPFHSSLHLRPYHSFLTLFFFFH